MLDNTQLSPRSGLFDQLFSDEPFPSIFPRSEFIPSSISDFVNSCFTSAKKAFPYPYNIEVNYADDKKTVVSYSIKVALAGFEKDELSIRLLKNKTLTININPMVDDATDKTYLVKGIAKRSGSISWSILPKIDIANFKSTFKDGILTIDLPVKSDEQSPDVIEIGIE